MNQNSRKVPNWTFRDPGKLMAFSKAIEAARVRGARIKDSGRKSLIREERENHVFPFSRPY